MKLTIEPTGDFQSFDGQPFRRWVGVTDSGVPIHAWIRCVQPQTHDEALLKTFDDELKALPPPRRELVSLNYRMV